MQAAGDVLRFPATLPGFAAAAEALRARLDAWQLKSLPRHNVEVVFEEIAVNIVGHGSPTEDVAVGVALEDEAVTLTFVDDGIAFDPREQEDPKLPLTLEDAKVGGLGILLVKRLATRVDYERTADGRNRLTVTLPAR